MVKVLSTEELERKLKEVNSIEQYKRWQTILIRTKNPKMPIEEVAALCGVKYKTVTQWWWLYNKEGAERMILTGRGGRHRNLMTAEEEMNLLKSLQEKAEDGHIVTAQSVKQAIEEKLCRTVGISSVYQILHRNGWRKIMPHTRHPKGDKDKQESFKKNF